MTVDELAIRAFYASRNPQKLSLVREIVDEANALGLSHDFLMQSLHRKYAAASATPAVPQLQRSGTQPPPRSPAPSAPSTADATSSTPYGATTWAKTDSAAARTHTDKVLLEEIREWLLVALNGIERPEMELLRTALNPLEALRNGALLIGLMERLKNPGCAAPNIRSGTNPHLFLDNINLFLRAAAGWVASSFLFVATDLLEGKNDRSVVTCLLALGRWALDNGRVAPRISRMEKEIDTIQPPSEAEIAQAIADAEVADTTAPVVEEADVDEANIDFEVAAVLGPPTVVDPTSARTAASPILTISPTVPPVQSSPVSSPKKYRAKANDVIDQRVGKAVNSFMAVMHRSGRAMHSRIIRTRQGEYVIYHRITEKRTVIHVRELSNALMVRVGGGWEDFDTFLSRRLVDVEVVPRGTIAERDRRARANTIGR